MAKSNTHFQSEQEEKNFDVDEKYDQSFKRAEQAVKKETIDEMMDDNSDDIARAESARESYFTREPYNFG